MDRRTDMTQLTFGFRNFANAPKNKITGFTDISIETSECSKPEHQRTRRRGYVWPVQFPIYLESAWHYMSK